MNKGILSYTAYHVRLLQLLFQSVYIMKQSLIFFLVIIAAACLYTLFGIITFTPDKAEPFVFNSPNLPQGITLPNHDAFATELTPEEIELNRKADETIDDALSTFRDMRDTIPQQALETLDILTNQADTSIIPIFFLSDIDPATNKRTFQTLKFEPTRWASIPLGKSSISCSVQNPPADILVGNDENNTLECNLQDNKNNSDRLLLGGPGADTITDTKGNRLVNGGTGDDTIALGAGRSTIVLDAAWGHDKVTVDCSNSHVTPDQLDSTFPVKYPYATTNFIILSPRLMSKDLKWDGNVLKSTTSDDTLTVNENCFTIVPSLSAQ